MSASSNQHQGRAITASGGSAPNKAVQPTYSPPLRYGKYAADLERWAKAKGVKAGGSASGFGFESFVWFTHRATTRCGRGKFIRLC